METLVDDIIENKSTDVNFDKSKIDYYEVKHEKNGMQEIHILNTLHFEETILIINKDYKIKSLITNKNSVICDFLIIYIIFCIIVGVFVSSILFGFYIIIKKTVHFFKK